jgi:hypothetical protein
MSNATPDVGSLRSGDSGSTHGNLRPICMEQHVQTLEYLGNTPAAEDIVYTEGWRCGSVVPVKQGTSLHISALVNILSGIFG